MTDGTVVLPGAPPGQPAASPPGRSRRRGLVFRTVPGTSALHRLGPATKISVPALATVVSFSAPGWPVIAGLAVLLAAGLAAARLPLTVFPRVPWLIAAIILLGAAAAAAGSGIVLYVESMLFTVLFFSLSLLLIWTTRVEDLPGAFTAAGGQPTGTGPHPRPRAARPRGRRGGLGRRASDLGRTATMRGGLGSFGD